MSTFQINSMSKQEDEKSFLKLCEFDRLQVDKYTIEHNLNKWKITIAEARMKGNHIQLQITVPYAEMNIEIEERMQDIEFFGKNVARLSISSKMATPDGLLNYIISKNITLTINPEIQYILFSTPYFYPHNWYTLTNKDYLYKKISYSVNFLDCFIKAYKDLFQTGIPLMYIKETRETRDHYEIDIILKEYLTISYVKTDLSIATLFFHLLVETNKKNPSNNQISKYHQITVIVPREIRTGVVDFKFTANMVQ